MLSRDASSRRRRAVLAHACPDCRQPWAVRALRNPDGVFLLVCRFCEWRDVRRSPALPPAAPSTGSAGGGQHVVLFADDDEQLLSRLCEHVAGALVEGRPCLVVASEPHRAALDTRLAARGLSVVAASGLVSLDAAATLGLFLRDGRPDPALFDASVGAVVRDVAADGGCVQAYGEMVALLWHSGATDAALELEHLWDRLGQRVDLSLLCAYPAAEVDDDGRERLCRAHTAVAA